MRDTFLSPRLREQINILQAGDLVTQKIDSLILTSLMQRLVKFSPDNEALHELGRGATLQKKTTRSQQEKDAQRELMIGEDNREALAEEAQIAWQQMQDAEMERQLMIKRLGRMTVTDGQLRSSEDLADVVNVAIPLAPSSMAKPPPAPSSTAAPTAVGLLGFVTLMICTVSSPLADTAA